MEHDIQSLMTGKEYHAMNEYETLLQKHLNAAQTEPGPDVRNRILESAASPAPASTPVRVNKGVKVLLIAALLIAALATTAFAYSDAIRQFMFGDSKIEQVEDMGIEGGGRIVAVGGVMDADETYWAELLAGNGNMYFDSVEEARETVPFALKNMTRLPESGGEWVLTHVSSGLNKDGVCGNNADIQYTLDYSYTDESGWLHTGNELLSLSQWHVGPDAYIDYTTVHDIEKVMIGDIEAAAVFDSRSVTLHWIADEMVYELRWAYNEERGMYSLEKLIGAAASII